MMFRRTAWLLGVVSLVAAVEARPARTARRRSRLKGQRVSTAFAGECFVSGPYQSGNLCVYLVHSRNAQKSLRLVTLDEALRRRLLIVRETGSVNRLVVYNRSRSHGIFLQGGEILSGGKQDRVIGTDTIVKPRARRMPITVYCVEQGRWHGSTSRFGTNSNLVRSVAAADREGRGDRQSTVWSRVGERQRELVASVPGVRRSSSSPTSMDATLRSPKLRDAVARYAKPIRRAIREHPDSIGLIFSVNGELAGADVYGSNALFRAMSPKLLKACAVEAISRKPTGPPPAPPDLRSAINWILAPYQKASTGSLADDVHCSPGRPARLDTEDEVVSDLRHGTTGGLIHMSIFKKPREGGGDAGR